MEDSVWLRGTTFLETFLYRRVCKGVMSKRGNIEAAIVLVVLFLAVVGAVFVFVPSRSSSGLQIAQVPEVQHGVGPSGGFTVPNVADSDSGNIITGHFAVPGAKEYGGAVRGIYDAHARAFAGRAIQPGYELPEQACYKCSCLTQGITATNKDAAAQVCTNNCGGSITSETVGQCQ